MKIACKLTRNGNATTICIPRRMLHATRWRAGDPMIVELTTLNSVTIRPPQIEDLRTSGVLGVLDNTLPQVEK